MERMNYVGCSEFGKYLGRLKGLMQNNDLLF